MGKLAWLTDTHLNFIDDENLWWDSVVKNNDVDGFLITGDITNSRKLMATLNMFGASEKPVYYVLGNHDYYHGSIEYIRDKVSKRNDNAIYFGNSDVIKLSEKSYLIGDDGWYDGRNGGYWRTNLRLSDFKVIDEFKNLGKSDRLMVMQRYADRSANRIADLCAKACENTAMQELIIGTHVPPFAGACWHMGMISDEEHLPLFSNITFGLAIKNGTEEFRKAGGIVKVFCGHTHSGGLYEPEKGLVVRTGCADYGHPEVCDIISYL